MWEARAPLLEGTFEEGFLSNSVTSMKQHSGKHRVRPVRPACGGSEGPWAIFLGKSHKEVGNSKGSQIHCAKKFSGSSKDCKIQSLLCDKASGNSKGSKIHCAKKFFLGAAKIARFSLYCATKLLGTAKVARFTVPKIFSARFSPLLCDKVSGNSKGSKVHCAKKFFLGAAKIARFSLYCATKLLGTAKVARFTVPKIFLRDSVFTVRQSFWEQQR